MGKFIALFLSLLTVSAGASAEDVLPTLAITDCPVDSDLAYVCGPMDAEDMVFIPGTRWLIASGVGVTVKPGALYLIDTDSKQWQKVFPGGKLATLTEGSPCVGYPDLTRFSPHGLGIEKIDERHYKLLVVNHGGREAIEKFEVNLRGDTPRISWQDCVVLPADVYANSVTPLPGGGFAATKFFDPRIPEGMLSIKSGQNPGHVLTWKYQSGFQVVPNSRAQGANGIVVSADGETLYFNAWADRQFIRLSRDGTQRDEVALDFHPDNVRWSDDGQLLVTGPFSSQILGCETCIPGWKVVRINPRTLALTTVLEVHDPVGIAKATVAAEGNGHVWVGSYKTDRIGYTSVPTADAAK